MNIEDMQLVGLAMPNVDSPMRRRLIELIDELHAAGGHRLPHPLQAEVARKLVNAGIIYADIDKLTVHDLCDAVGFWHRHQIECARKNYIRARPSWGLGYLKNVIVAKWDAAHEADKAIEREQAMENRLAVTLGEALSPAEELENWKLIQQWRKSEDKSKSACRQKKWAGNELAAAQEWKKEQS